MDIQFYGLNIFRRLSLLLLLSYMPAYYAQSSDPSEEPIAATEVTKSETFIEQENTSMPSANPVESDTQPLSAGDGSEPQPTMTAAAIEPSPPTTTAATDFLNKWAKNLLAAKYMTSLGVLYIAVCIFMAIKAGGPLVVH